MTSNLPFLSLTERQINNKHKDTRAHTHNPLPAKAARRLYYMESKKWLPVGSLAGSRKEAVSESCNLMMVSIQLAT